MAAMAAIGGQQQLDCAQCGQPATIAQQWPRTGTPPPASRRVPVQFQSLLFRPQPPFHVRRSHSMLLSFVSISSQRFSRIVNVPSNGQLAGDLRAAVSRVPKTAHLLATGGKTRQVRPPFNLAAAAVAVAAREKTISSAHALLSPCGARKNRHANKQAMESFSSLRTHTILRPQEPF